MQEYGRARVSYKGFEVEEVVNKPVEGDCGMPYQAAVIAKSIHDIEGRNIRCKGRLLPPTKAWAYVVGEMMEGNGLESLEMLDLEPSCLA